MQIGDRVRVVGLSTPYASDHRLGKPGVLKRVFGTDEANELRFPEATHVVALEEWHPHLYAGVSAADCPIGSDTDFGHDPEDIHEYLFVPSDLRLERDAREPFWQIYYERWNAHHGEARRRANRACNLWRCHQEVKATELARSCHLLNLIFSAMAEPHGWRRSRIGMDDLIELCRAAGKSDREIADFLYHIRLGGRPSETFDGLLLRCTCFIA